MTISDGTILRIVASLLLPDSVIAQNIFYAVFTDSGVSNDAVDVVSDLAVWVEAMYAEFQSSVVDEVVADIIQVYEYDPIDQDWDEVGVEPWSDVFGSLADMVPHGVAPVVHAKTTNPDVTGTKYIAGFSEVDIVESDIQPTPLGRVVNFATEWVQSFVGVTTEATFAPGVWSPTKENFFIFSGTIVANGIVGYQRRRKPGVGI